MPLSLVSNGKYYSLALSKIIHSALFSPQARTQLVDDAALLRTMLLRKLTWLLLICYSLMLIKPVVPVIADVLAHTFNERQHMMTVHEEHGRFHIHYEQQKQDGNTDKSKPVHSAKYQQEDCAQVSENINAATMALYTNQPVVYTGYACHFPSAEADKEYIPPRA